MLYKDGTVNGIKGIKIHYSFVLSSIFVVGRVNNERTNSEQIANKTKTDVEGI